MPSVIYKLRRPPGEHRIVSSARIEELGDEVRGLAGFLDHGEVSGIFDDREPRSSDPSRSLLRRLPRELDVVAAGEDERGGPESWEVRVHGGVASPPREPWRHERPSAGSRHPRGDHRAHPSVLREPTAV